MNLNMLRKDTLMFLLILFTGIRLYAQHDCVKIKLSVNKKDQVLRNGILINISLFSNCEQKLKVHKEYFFLVDKNDDVFSDAYFEVKADNPSETDSAMEGTTDCDPFVPDKVSPFKILSKGQSINYTFDLGCYYHFIKGHRYRIRLYYKLSQLNPSFKNVWSEWLIVKK